MRKSLNKYAESLGKHFTVRAFQTVPGCFVTVFHETAHNKQMEQVYYRSRDQLKENEKKFLQSILDNAPVGILVDCARWQTFAHEQILSRTGRNKHGEMFGHT